ncbi:hypothetical protein [Bacteriophage Phi NF-1]|uniref:Uncharacterized protein n=1 Tax=Bacteriophage Phi NF-1 TaxID=2900273 RepID=A0A976MGF3_9CAUD|nr:hypothetical protein [Bacteriophage Phi NF-1]
MINRSKDRLALFRNRAGVVSPGIHGLEVVLYSEIDNYRCTRKSINAIFPYDPGDEVLGRQYRAAKRHLDKLSDVK